MANKIFVSYRREDSAANALGISQYLEREFGRKNVFIDIDMRAGAKFPVVLEKRLKECAVMLVLIGPQWLEVRDAEGKRRLDNPDDWVRLELSMALKREITVIPVLVGGATLPPKAALPDDIKGLVEHQSATISNAGFRSDMAGLVRDIRPEQDNKLWTKVALAGAALGVLALLVFAVSFDWTTRPSSDPKPQASSAAKSDSGAKPESGAKVIAETAGPDMKGWTLYGYVLATKIPHYMRLDSVRVLQDKVSVERRAFKEPGGDPQHPDAYYDQGVLVFDCKNSSLATAEISTFSKSGKLLENSVWGDALSLDPLMYSPLIPGSIGDSGHYLMCGSDLRVPLVSGPLDATARKLTALSATSAGDGGVFYDPSVVRAIDGTIRATLLTRLFKDTSTTRLFPDLHPSMPALYRFLGERIVLDCKQSRVTFLKTETYNSASEMIHVRAVRFPASEAIVETSPVDSLKKTLCK
jgi:hypothetical protein